MIPRVISASNASELYHATLNAIVADGQVVHPRGHGTRELLGTTLHLSDASRNIVLNRWRNLNYRFMAAEFAWIASGSALVEHIVPFNSKLLPFSDNGITFVGAYGPMWIEQFPYVLDTLTHDGNSRQAVVSIWRPRPGPSADVPCTLTWQFLIRDGKLHMVTNMRSNDAWLGLPYDLFTFTSLQRLVASVIDMPVGSYTHHVGSLHLYDEHIELVPLEDDDAATHPMGIAHWEKAPSPGTLGQILTAARDTPKDNRAAMVDVYSQFLPKYWRDLIPLMMRHPSTTVDEPQIAAIMRRWSFQGDNSE